MFSRLTRAALPALLVAVVAVAVTLVISPEARAAVEALLTFNGVTVTVDDDGKLVTSGNTDAIVHQDDYSVAIQSDDGCGVMGVAIAPPTTSEFIPSTTLSERFADLKLPKVPAGYTLASQAEVISDGTLVLTWADAAGQTITYTRNPNQPVTIGVGSDDGKPCNPAPGAQPAAGALPPVGELNGAGGSFVGGTNDPGEGVTNTVTVSAGDGQAAHVWEADGYMHLLSATDPALTPADLAAMQP